MTTTGELRAIIEELELVDVGDAASYLGEEAIVEEASPIVEATPSTYTHQAVYAADDECAAQLDCPTSIIL